jgi:peptidoglycan hydrolase-like protein with peptidoglycan-binding domain
VSFAAAEIDEKTIEGAVEGGGRTLLECERDCAAPFAVVEVYVASAPVRIATVRANALGGYALSVQLPVTLAPGAHKVIVATTGVDGRPAFYANAITVVPAGKVKAPVRVKCPAVLPKVKARTAKAVQAYNQQHAACLRQAAAARAFYRGLPFPGLLKIGSRGKNVLIVQQALGSTEDGRYGNTLFAAVRSFQRAQRLNVKKFDDGAVNRATWNALFNPRK